MPTMDDFVYNLIMEYNTLRNDKQSETFYNKHFEEVKKFVSENSRIKDFKIYRTKCKDGDMGWGVMLHTDDSIVNNHIAYHQKATALLSVTYAVFSKDNLVV